MIAIIALATQAGQSQLLIDVRPIPYYVGITNPPTPLRFPGEHGCALVSGLFSACSLEISSFTRLQACQSLVVDSS